MKKCRVCKIEKDLVSYNKFKESRDGLRHICKACQAIEKKTWDLNNKERKTKYKKQWDEQNRKHISKYKKNRYWEDPEKSRKELRERSAKRTKLGVCRNHPKEMAVVKGFCQSCRLLSTLRGKFKKALRGNGLIKEKSMLEIAGCSISEMKLHLEKQFKPGMSWENYGKWHVDHIRPLASAKTDEDLKQIFHYTNLQPLWAQENLAKSSYYNGTKYYYNKKAPKGA